MNSSVLKTVPPFFNTKHMQVGLTGFFKHISSISLFLKLMISQKSEVVGSVGFVFQSLINIKEYQSKLESQWLEG